MEERHYQILNGQHSDQFNLCLYPSLRITIRARTHAFFRDGDADNMKNEGLQSQPIGNAGGQVIASHFSRRQAAPFAIMTSADQNETTTVDVPGYASDDWGDDY